MPESVIMVPVNCRRCNRYLCHTNQATTVDVRCPKCGHWTEPQKVEIKESEVS